MAFSAHEGGPHAPVQVEVIDNGRGIPDELRDNVFDPFVSGRSGGSGLGLTMVASVIADHGGMMEFDSSPGRTVFRFNFPVGSGRTKKKAVGDSLIKQDMANDGDHHD
jgi:two-component system nitrogen regulation sensor histidine kinase GlnL